jgi:hypothetical protein
MACECGRPAIGIVFTKGDPRDIPVCKKCQRANYPDWNSQSLNTAASPTGLMIRTHLKRI